VVEPAEVALSQTREVRFPDRCVVCGAECRGSVVALPALDSTLFGYLKWVAQRSRKVVVPAHGLCGTKLSRATQGRGMVLLFVVTIPLIVGVAREWPMWSTIAASLVLFVLMARWQGARPLPLEITVSEGKLEFSFRDADYARRFAILNGGEVRRGG